MELPARHLLTVLDTAERTGPQVLALQFLQWLRLHRPDWRISTLVIAGGGELEPAFAEVGHLLVAEDGFPYGVGTRLTHQLHVRHQYRRLRRLLASLPPIDLAHVHCAGTMRVVPGLGPVPILCHLHELDVGLELHLGPIAQDHLAMADRYVAVSDQVGAAFLNRTGADPDRVDVQWGFVDPARLPTASDRAGLGIPDEAFVVVGAGVRHWRKAPELFVRTALHATQLAPEIPWRFVWVGGEDRIGVDALLRRSGLEGTVAFLPHQPDPLPWFAAADAFLLPAREDAFPLVCIEAAALGVPIVTFDNGGAAELVRRSGCGTVVPFPDVRAGAGALVALTRNGAASAAGRRGRDFAAQHLLLERAGPALLASIEATAKGSR